MKKIPFLKKTFIFLTILALTLNFNPVYAQLSYQQVCVSSYTVDTPSIYAIICPVIRILNVLLLMSGAVFVLMVLMAAYRYSMALGDPKGVEGAHSTITYAVIGLTISVGVYVILRIIGELFDVKDYYTTVPNLFESFFTAFQDLLNYANITP